MGIDEFIDNNSTLTKLDLYITDLFNRYGIVLLRYSIGIVFIWFGALKPIGKSPAEDLIRETIVFLPFDYFIIVLGIWEVLIGITLIIRRFNRIAILLLFLQMPGTMLPLILLPEVCFSSFPFVLTLEGQYIVKNLVLITSGIVIGGNVRMVSDQKQLL